MGNIGCQWQYAGHDWTSKTTISLALYLNLMNDLNKLK